MPYKNNTRADWEAYKQATSQRSPREDMFDDEACGCYLPEHSCKYCRAEARKLYKLEETY